FFFQAEDGIRDKLVTGVQTCALPICRHHCLAVCREGQGEEHGAMPISELSFLPRGRVPQSERAVGAAGEECLAVRREGDRGELRSEERRVGKEWRARWSRRQTGRSSA